MTQKDLIEAINTLEGKPFAQFLYKAGKENHDNYSRKYNALSKKMKLIVIKKLHDYCKGNNNSLLPEVLEAP